MKKSFNKQHERTEYHNSKIDTVCKELNDVLNKKNADYGDSALTLPVLCKNLTSYDGIMVRLGDKFLRLRNLNGGHKDSVGESIRDTILDIAGYCVLALIALDSMEKGND